MRVPTVMGVSETDLTDMQDQAIIVDGYFKQIYINSRLYHNLHQTIKFIISQLFKRRMVLIV